MSEATRVPSSRRSTGRLARIAAGSVLLVATAGIALPAHAAVTYALHAASDYSLGETWTTNGNQGRSYAQHGNLSASTGWTTQHSRAFADSGTSSSYYAQVWWR
jgi:hypothetical protein